MRLYLSSILHIFGIAECYNDSMNQEIILARRIKQAREEAGLSQSRLGEYLGIDQPGISKLESGATEVGAIRLVRISEVLGRPVTWFLGIDTGLSDDEAEALHLYRQLESPALRENTLTILRAQVEADRQMREERS